MKKLLSLIFSAALLSITLILPFKSELFYQSMKSGIEVCITTLIPSLFPFIFFSSLLFSYCGELLSVAISPVICPLFNISVPAASAFAAGLFGGFPTGGAVAAELYGQGKIYKDEAERLPVFSNNAGIVFVISSLGIGHFKSFKIGLTLYLVHILSSVILGVVTRPREKMYRIPPKTLKSALKTFSPKPITQIFPKCAVSSVRSMSSVCANYLIFKMLCALLFENLTFELMPIAYGFFEMVGGIFSLTEGPYSLVAASFILGFNGLCIHMQTAVFFSEHKLSVAKCVLGKAAVAFLSAAIMYFVPTVGIKTVFISVAAVLFSLAAILKGRSDFIASTSSNKKDTAVQSRSIPRKAPLRFFRRDPLL